MNWKFWVWVGLIRGLSASEPQWTWLSGFPYLDPQGQYDPSYIPTSLNAEYNLAAGGVLVPGARTGAAMWALDDKLYLFGGSDAAGFFLNDTWEFDLNHLSWSWISGSSSFDYEGLLTNNFSTPFQVFAPENLPLARREACSFTYNSELYLYGGNYGNITYLFVSDGSFRTYPTEKFPEDWYPRVLADMWKFNVQLKQWAWIAGPLSFDPSGSYGQLDSYPSAAFGINCWKNPVNGMFFIYGGAKDFVTKEFSDELWAFNVSSYKWSLLAGNKTFPRPKTVQASINKTITPGTRAYSATWDSNDFLYLFGGYGFTGEVHGDVWMYNVSSNRWKLLFEEYASSRGSWGLEESEQYPGRRFGSYSWTNEKGNLLLFGGDYRDYKASPDLWEFDLTSYSWTWIDGNSTIVDTYGEYISRFMSESESSQASQPLSHSYASFVNYNGNYFAFGGQIILDFYPFNSNMLWRLRFCPKGDVSSDGNDCIPCPPDFIFTKNQCFNLSCFLGYSRSEDFRYCEECLPGKFQNRSCIFCPHGKSSIGGPNPCYDCSFGTYSRSGDSICLNCERGKYSDSLGVSECESCGPNTTSFDVGKTSFSDCICAEGFWGKPPSCTSCTTSKGLRCPENSLIPYVESGYFRDKDKVDEVYLCLPQKACFYTGFSLETTCSSQYDGWMCARCQEQYYRKNFECIECPKTYATILVFLIAVFILLILLCKLLTSKQEIPVEVRIGIASLQIIALFPGLSEKWPRNLIIFFDISSISNFNINIFSPECSLAIDFLKTSILKLWIPPAILMLLLALYAILRKCRANTKPLDGKLIVNFTIQIISVLYTMLASSVLSIFNCSTVRNGVSILTLDPSIECYAAKWWSHFPFFVLAMILYLFAFPAYILYYFWIYRKNPKDISTQFFSLTRLYRTEVFYYEIIAIAKKLTFVISSDFLALGRPRSTKIFLTIFFLFVFFSIESRLRPYSLELHNHVSTSWNIVTIVVLLSALVFQSEEVTESDRETFGILMILLISSILLYSVFKILNSRMPRISRLPQAIVVRRESAITGTVVIKEDPPPRPQPSFRV